MTIFLLTNSCRKDKLTGDNATLSGTWNWTDAHCACLEFPFNPQIVGYSLKLELIEKGKYKLYKNDKKIEHGRLLKVHDFYTFKDDDIRKKDDRLDGLKIIYCKNDTLEIDMGICGDDCYYIFTRD